MSINRRDALKMTAGLAVLSAIRTTMGDEHATHIAEHLKTREEFMTFDLGMPTPDTVEHLYDEMDFQRATQCYLWSVPIVGMESARQMLVDNAEADSGDLVLVHGYREVSVMLGSNVTTPYVFAYFDLSHGPMLLHYPPGATAGSLIDWWDRPLTDVGMIGPDAGNGAVYILVGPGHVAPAAVPADAHILHSRTCKVLMFCRGLDTDLDKVVAVFSTTKVALCSSGQGPQRARLLRFKPEGELTSMAHPGGMAYWSRLTNALRGQPVEERDRFFAAMLRPLGIETNRDFSPDERQRVILEKAASLGEAMAKVTAFNKRLAGIRYREDTRWEYLIAPHYDNEQDGPAGALLEERTAFFYEVTGTSAAVLTQTPGVGSAYLAAYQDKSGAAFDGGRSYRLRVPPHVPAKLFWSVTLYDTQTRGLIRNPQEIADRSSRQDLLKNPDGSIDIIFGPTAPAGYERNWIPTTPTKSWYTYFRLFGPLDPYFERSWVLADIEPVLQIQA
ncbi:DUF1214 domain-containing protein [Pseudomonas gingeri]|uniref:DUF1254 domain-containing protein n=1 Tax=Pseudomonas gingeri TaxID=117681 RepID=A0A7Y8CLX9_9PSED|nr:DUF1214 domain-containing protein [Pseudomonas gingeri]NWB31309.1 DUF1254 domain-containing protein [Pseudomonas gingeri]NWC35827.1 DUF1254 domain-containing protein [Pseudomonas gingeri]NWD06294.1 DUF1254 domain-containing protein [Pseudomonas gingeri]NWD49337.1 DUF1254 domain-containing protein [Pseudomonas gingeri]NWE32868.1 DUF1254 domain-containing protein [Pseudomonas gingeri]